MHFSTKTFFLFAPFFRPALALPCVDAQQVLTKSQATIARGFQSIDSDWESFKSVYADDAYLKICFAGQPECIEGDFDQINGPLKAAIKTFRPIQPKIHNLSGASHKDFSRIWTTYIETPLGCAATISGVSTYEFNDEGKVVRQLSFSEDSEDVLACITQFYETQPTLQTPLLPSPFVLPDPVPSAITEQSLTDNQAAIVSAFKLFDSDWWGFKNLYADDAVIKFCFTGQPDCVEGDFEEAFGPFKAAVKTFNPKLRFMMNDTSDNEVTVFWEDHIEFKNGCFAVVSGVATHEFNQEGKITRHVAFSDDSEDMMACLANYELQANKLYPVASVANEQTLTDNQATLASAFELVDSDWEGFKSLYAEDAFIQFCFPGERECVQGGFEEVFGPFETAVKTFDVTVRFLTNDAADKTVTVVWKDRVVFQNGCSAIISGVATHEFNKEGKVTRHIDAFSDDADDMMACFAEYELQTQEE